MTAATETPLLLVVDDDAALRRLVADFLASHGYRVLEAADGAAMRDVIARHAVDCAILDVMMPGEDGVSLARALSVTSGVAVVMMSALGDETDRIVGLEAGADDYLPKPISPRELLARVRAVLRRRAQGATAQESGQAYLFDGWVCDLRHRTLRDPTNVVVGLSQGEFSLLLAFLERPQRILTRDQLLESSRGATSEAYDRSIDTQVSRLRRKLSARSRAELIRTVRSEGYVFTAPVARR